MTISNPAHWKEPFADKGDKWDKIVEMIAELNTPTATPADHASEHQDGGGDEISVAGLSGALADDQTPTVHDNTKHTTDYATESYVDAHYKSGLWWIGGNNFLGNLQGMTTDGIRVYENNAAATWIFGYVPLAQNVQIAGSTKWLKLTQATVYWWQNAAGDNLDRFRFRKHRLDTLASLTVLDDTTNRGVAGDNSYAYTLSVNNTLDATYQVFGLLIYYIKAAAADWRLTGVKFAYDYV